MYCNITEEDIDKRIKFLPEECDFEKYLVNHGYQKELLRVIGLIEQDEDYLSKYIDKKNGTEKKRIKTNEKCSKCNQNIFKAPIRDYSGNEGYQEALLDYLKENKTEYSSMIGSEILKRKDKTKIPDIIQEMFLKYRKLRISRLPHYMLKRGDKNEVDS